ncbi:putative DNA repair and recombination protein RAD54 [Leptomonas pyrrhocoris]|uniref:Putative DNA repair and recombination protein RAD54 n=1 Tax=Leptomonas pyrrhocoris TaxID=157538 RepID=A0A0M9FZH2_LEPPY|nr:putative DNA repair and recombination protein RAD54 [Leptomonas pyrrhocoris]XP_015657538.1 putative DNA repair and recombination protein RAD54 [Leptomonas pyrrhocoris]KPA79098.1 putative DNA repair and recombination protein RAD54 [Leptomonas pyrrhocoris]KPA79099.1 putative DNA repair and recombination protein RAD54 [Leptomonas pyrrhocoris]|eukprot:XP_015657537.1 putative DNA repair and recombination protein RAD54 [Leptomonas pyrrhocoris]
MPLLRKSAAGTGVANGTFRPPTMNGSDDAKTSRNALKHKASAHPVLPPTSAAAVPRFMASRRAVEGHGSSFKKPSGATEGEKGHGMSEGPGSVELPGPTVTCLTSTGVRRAVMYPSAPPRSAVCSANQQLIAHRLARRSGMDYHQPASAVKAMEERALLAAAAARGDTADEDGGDATSTKVATAKLAKVEGTAGGVKAVPGAATATNGCGDAAAGGGDNTEAGAASAGSGDVEDDGSIPAAHVVSRYPVSPYGKLYFQVETEAATRHESVGIIIVDTEELGVMMYDRVGRQFGNRPEPGYPLKQEEVDNAKAGVTLKVGAKSVLLVTALTEEAFRSGEFFLRSEHDLRVKEDKAKAKADAAAAEEAKSRKPKMSFGNSLGGSNAFAAILFRRRPQEGQTGFVVPVAGRPKVGKNGIIMNELCPLHDPDREKAVVLFRADYKRDLLGRRQVSVVVDPIIGDKLRPHQVIGVKFLFDCITGERMPGYHGAILADEMGLGKTIQTVATIYTCLKQGKHGQPTARKCLVVTPSSLVKNWCNEFDKWLGEGAVKHFAISESTPKGDRIISRFDGDGDVLVISYDQLRKYVTRISGLRSIELVVCDEGHRLKNAEVKTTKAVDMLPTRNRIILSGTPIQNDLSEFHAMVGFVNPGILGNRDLFARVFEEPVSLGRDPGCPDHLKSLGRDRAHYLSTLTQRFILRRTQSINESYLPPKVDVTVFVRLGAQQMQAYEKLAAMVETAECTPLVLISALRKLCNHMDLFYDAVRLSHQIGVGGGGKGAQEVEQPGKRRGRAPGSSPGIPYAVLPKGFKPGSLSMDCGSKIHFVSLVLDEIRANGEHDKLVIVSNFTQTLDIIAALCTAKQIAYFQLDGSTPIKKRQQLVDYFNVPGSQEIVFLLSSKAGGVGLNLIGANRLILFDPDWNPANDAQAMGRVWRDGQQKRVFIYRLLSTGTIEEKIYQRQVSKQGLSANVVDMQEDSKQHFTLEELKSLFKYKSDTLCDTHDLLGCTTCEAAAAALQAASGSRGSRGGKAAEPPQMRFRKVGQAPKKSGPRMDELKAWRHLSDVAKFNLDKVTRVVAAHAPSLLSFLFADERDNTKTAGPVVSTRVKVDKPAFEEDAEAITCASQAAMQQQESEMEIEVIDDDDDEEDEASSSDEEEE